MKTLGFFVINGGIMLLVFLVFLVPVMRYFSEPGEGGIAALILAAGMLVSMVVGYAWGSYICQRLNILPLKPKKGREVERKN